MEKGSLKLPQFAIPYEKRQAESPEIGLLWLDGGIISLSTAIAVADVTISHTSEFTYAELCKCSTFKHPRQKDLMSFCSKRVSENNKIAD